MNHIISNQEVKGEVAMPAPEVFNFQECAVRTVVRNGEVWFVAIDVCNALGYQNSRKAIADHLDADERCNQSLHRGGEITIINESGLYALVLRSRKPQARKFAKWVTNEVLPSIRKNGAYIQSSVQIDAAYKLASHVASVAAHTVFQAFLTGEHKHHRWMFHMNWHKDEPDAWAVPIEHDAMVVSVDELPHRLLESGATYATNKQLIDISMACQQRISQRLSAKVDRFEEFTSHEASV